MKKYTVLYFILYFSIGSQAQDAAFYKKFFPDPSYSMPVPITTGNKSYNYFTKFKDAVQFIEGLAGKHPQLIKIGSIGETQRGNDQISVLVTNQNSSDEKKLRVAIIGGIHGNEPIST